MIHSMTGFGKATIDFENYEISFEIKSVNSRYLDLSLRVPAEIHKYDMELTKVIKSRIQRGNVTLYVNINGKQAKTTRIIDSKKVGNYFETLKKIGKENGINSEISWETLLNFDDIYEDMLDETKEGAFKEAIFTGLNNVLDNFISFRSKEGEELKKYLLDQKTALDEIVKKCEDLAVDAAQIQYNKLKERLQKRIDLSKLAPERLEQELVIMSDKVDISEETSRLNSHIKLFSDTLEKGGVLGQRLNFISQEMNREANTIASKTNLTEISHFSIKIKSIIEKIREQVQNLE